MKFLKKLKEKVSSEISLGLAFLVPMFLFVTRPAYARSLKATADKMTQDVTQIGYSVAVLGLVIAGIYLALGKQDATSKVINCIFGMVCIFAAQGVVALVKGAA